MSQPCSRFRVFTDEQWERVEALLPSNLGRRGHPFGDNRRVVEGIVYRYRTGIPWRDLPREEFGPWQTVWKRHRRYAGDGTWDRILTQILAEADADGQIDFDGIGGCDDHPCPPARDEHDAAGPGHRGHARITRISPWTCVNLQVMASAGPGVG